jgi:hypothetical protein
MDAKQEKLQKEAKELVKIKKDENVALRKIIMAMTKNATTGGKPRK